MPLTEQLRRFRALLDQRARLERERAHDVEDGMKSSSTPQETTSVRAKSQGHKKSTADKWNQ